MKNIDYYFGVLVGALIVSAWRPWFHVNLQWWQILLWIPVWVLIEVAVYLIRRSRRARAIRKTTKPTNISDFDAWCVEHNIKSSDAPAAFATWLRETTGWDGEYGKVGDS